MMGLTSGHHPNSQCVGCESSGWPLFFPAHHLRKAHKIGKMNPSSGWSESLPCRTCTQGGGAGKISPILSTWNRKVSNTFTCMLKPSVCLQNCVPALAWISFLSSLPCVQTRFLRKVWWLEVHHTLSTGPSLGKAVQGAANQLFGDPGQNQMHHPLLSRERKLQIFLLKVPGNYQQISSLPVPVVMAGCLLLP